MLAVLFWILVILTVITGFLQTYMGYNLLGTIIILLIADFVVLGASLETEKRKRGRGNEIATKLEGIEKACSGIFEHITGISSNPGPGISEKQTENINYLLDKMAKKALSVEERLNQFGETLASSITRLDERVRNLEGGEKTEEIEEPEEMVEIKPVEEQAVEEPSITEEISSSD
jgi:hypothetical protein